MPEIKLVIDGDFEDETPSRQNNGDVTADSLLAVIENFTLEEQNQIEQFADKINLRKPGIVLNYGSTIQKQSAAIADKTLHGVRTNNTGEISDLLAQMITALDILEGGKDKGGFLSDVFRALGKTKSSSAADSVSAERTLELISKQLERHRLILQKDISMLDDLYKQNLQIYKALTMYIKAGEIALDRARSGELSKLRTRAAITGNSADLMTADSFEQICDQFDKQLQSLRLTRTCCLQFAPQINMIRRNDEDMCIKLRSSIVNTIPLWKQKIAVASALDNSLNAAKTSNSIDNLSGKTLREQVSRFRLGMAEAKNAANAGIVDTETIEDVNKEIKDAVLDYAAIERQGINDRQNAAFLIEQSEYRFTNGIR